MSERILTETEQYLGGKRVCKVIVYRWNVLYPDCGLFIDVAEDYRLLTATKASDQEQTPIEIDYRKRIFDAKQYLITKYL
jgi:hypothetical protein